MNQKECLKKLEDFRELLINWNNLSYLSSDKDELRAKINKSYKVVNNIISKSECLKLYTIAPPPMIRGFILKNINPFDIIFNPPHYFDSVKVILDMIDCAIGVIETDVDFSLESKVITTDEKEVSTYKNISNKIFIVHGHDNEMKETIARFLEKIKLDPVILHEKSNRGMTIIEKFEENSDVSFAVVLMSPDDVGNSKEKKDDLLNRARQNVIFELGYFFGKLGRSKVCVLIKDTVEKPTDYDGIIYIPYDTHGGWKTSLARELKNSGLSIDMNNI